jgi:hypothetical protein
MTTRSGKKVEGIFDYCFVISNDNCDDFDFPIFNFTHTAFLHFG